MASSIIFRIFAENHNEMDNLELIWSIGAITCSIIGVIVVGYQNTSKNGKLDWESAMLFSLMAISLSLLWPFIIIIGAFLCIVTLPIIIGKFIKKRKIKIENKKNYIDKFKENRM